MSDATDAVAEAMARTRRLAASRTVRKEEIQAELAKRKEQRASLADLDGAEAEALRGELDARIAALASELAVADGELRAAMTEIAELEKLAGQARVAGARAVVAAAADADPVLRSPEETALDNARA